VTATRLFESAARSALTSAISVTMPSVAEARPTFESLTAHLPVTHPVPTPVTHPSLFSPKDLTREEDLLRNPFSFRHWWNAINTTRDAQNALVKLQKLDDILPIVTELLGPLASPVARQTAQRLTYLYESALVNFSGSFKMWKSYLQMRMYYVLGKQIPHKRSGGKKRLPEMKEALEDEQEYLEDWEGGVDGIVGWEEWKALVATFERALMWLPKVRCLHLRLENATEDHILADASHMAHVPLNIQPPAMSSRTVSYPCPSHL
jgi:pre-mRNA-splicing factor SYF1